MLKTKSIATVGNRNRYGANREPHRDGLGGVTEDLPSAGDIVFGALIRNCFDLPNVGRARLPNGLKMYATPRLLLPTCDGKHLCDGRLVRRSFRSMLKVGTANA